MYVTASVLLTLTFLAVGISFFAPYWLSNIPAVQANETAWINGSRYINDSVKYYPDRGLWAQCGLRCYWFWNDNYRLQKQLLTPLKWHLATQILYFIAATLILFCEFYARVQMCCDPRRSVFMSLAIILFISAVLQLASVATFGGGASNDPYNAISDPAKFTKYLGQAMVDFNRPYLGWCYWMAVVGDMLTIASGVFFVLAGCFADDD
jgi:hypothetical protein